VLKEVNSSRKFKLCRVCIINHCYNWIIRMQLYCSRKSLKFRIAKLDAYDHLLLPLLHVLLQEICNRCRHLDENINEI